MKRFRGVLPWSGTGAPSATSASSSLLTGRLRSNSTPTSRSLYTSNTSPLSLFEPGVAPPTSRSHVVARLEARLEAEIHGNYTHANGSSHPSQNTPIPGSAQTGAPLAWSMAVTSPYSNPLSSPYSLIGTHPLYLTSPVPSTSSHAPPTATSREPTRQRERSRSRYHFDAGAYGIPKHGASQSVSYRQPVDPHHELDLSVSVGEDAYFIRDNAMGVADGVGGWAHCLDDSIVPYAHDASALFSRRLMHFCSAEVDNVDHRVSQTTNPRNKSVSLFESQSNSDRQAVRRSRSPHRVCDTIHPNEEQLVEELRDSLEDLEDGLDILMILEQAYENTLKAHVVYASDTMAVTNSAPGVSTSSPVSEIGSPQTDYDAISPALTLASSNTSSPANEVKPLMAGSSTALVAILDQVATSTTSTGIRLGDPSLEDAPDHAVLRIAHLGDSMGMLIRGDEIVWRSEEMWSRFNTPYQLGPCSQMSPKDANIFTIPVEADDIFILATDGLSDNLWDEEILDEVIRFRRSFLQKQPSEIEIVPAPEKENIYLSQGLLGRKALAGMLSEALCSRARRVADRGHGHRRSASDPSSKVSESIHDDTPFAHRAREHGRKFRGGKIDDISVVVAVISPTI